MEKLQRHQLEFSCDQFVGFNSRTGSVILGEVEEPVLCKFSFTQESGSYRKVWKRKRPVISDIIAMNSKTRCRKYLSVMDDLILQPLAFWGGTCMFHHDNMKQIGKWQDASNFADSLVTCLPGPRAVFAIRDQDQIGWHIEIKDQTNTLMSLRPSGHQWQNCICSLSACEDTISGTIAVTEVTFDNSSSLDIFSCDGMYGKSQYIVFFFS